MSTPNSPAHIWGDPLSAPMANSIEQLDWGTTIPDLSVPRKRDRPISFDAGSFHLSEGDGQFSWGEQFLNLSPEGGAKAAVDSLGQGDGGLSSLLTDSADNSEFLSRLQLQEELFGGGTYEQSGVAAYELNAGAAYEQDQGTSKQNAYAQGTYDSNVSAFDFDLYNQNPETLAQLDLISAEEFLQQARGALPPDSSPAGMSNQTPQVTSVPFPHPALVAASRKPPQGPSKTMSHAEIQEAYTQSWGGQKLQKAPSLVPQEATQPKETPGADREWTVDGAKTEAASIIRDLFRRPEAKRQAVVLEGGRLGFLERKEKSLDKPLNQLTMRSKSAKPLTNPSTNPSAEASPKPPPEIPVPARSISAPSTSSGGSFSQPGRPPTGAQLPRTVSASPDSSSEPFPFQEEGDRASQLKETVWGAGVRVAQALSLVTDAGLPTNGGGFEECNGGQLEPSDLRTGVGLDWLPNAEPITMGGNRGGLSVGPSLHRLWAELPPKQLEAAEFQSFRTLYKEEVRRLRCWAATFVGKGLLPSIPELHYVICNALPGQRQRQARMMFTKGLLWGAYVSNTLDGASPCDLYYVRHDSQREFKEGPLQKLANLSKEMQHKVLNIVYLMEDLKDEATYGPELYRTYGALHKSGGVALPPPVRGHAYHQIAFPELTSPKPTSSSAEGGAAAPSDDDVAIIKFEEKPLFNPSTLLPNGHLAPWGSFWYNKKRLLATGKGLTHAGERARQLVQNLAMQTLTAHVNRYDCLASGGMPTLEKYLHFARYDLGISTALGLAFCAIGQGLAEEGLWEPSADALNGLFEDVGKALGLTSQVFRIMSDLRTYQDDLVHCRVNAVAIRMREALCCHQEAIDFLTAKAASDVEALESEILAHASKDRFLSQCWQLAFDVCRTSVASFMNKEYEQCVQRLILVP